MTLKEKIIFIYYYFNFSILQTIQNVIFAHQKYWKCFQVDFLLSQSFRALSMYSYDEEPLSEFPTFNCYPTQDISKIDEFSVLQHLISGEDKFKCAFNILFQCLKFIFIETQLLNINNKVCVSFDLIMDQKHESSERYNFLHI